MKLPEYSALVELGVRRVRVTVHENTSVSPAVYDTAIHCPTPHGGIISYYAIVCKPGLGLTFTSVIRFMNIPI